MHGAWLSRTQRLMSGRVKRNEDNPQPMASAKDNSGGMPTIEHVPWRRSDLLRRLPGTPQRRDHAGEHPLGEAACLSPQWPPGLAALSLRRGHRAPLETDEVLSRPKLRQCPHSGRNTSVGTTRTALNQCRRWDRHRLYARDRACRCSTGAAWLVCGVGLPPGTTEVLIRRGSPPARRRGRARPLLYHQGASGALH